MPRPSLPEGTQNWKWICCWC